MTAHDCPCCNCPVDTFEQGDIVIDSKNMLWVKVGPNADFPWSQVYGRVEPRKSGGYPFVSTHGTKIAHPVRYLGRWND